VEILYCFHCLGRHENAMKTIKIETKAGMTFIENA
jgi:hypothetical protein